ncbi:hypothetical protein AA0112_g6799 [Alternaria arborescens]|nr:hypothetical protein AA0112_g6799 [Alternaria arborescens]
MAPRRPSTAGDIDSRMPFASAEMLLWGPEMKQQHAHLLTEMRKLQRHHEAYDIRIKTTEHVAGAAEAATSRIRHLEQQLAAIEAEDDDKAFEKWAMGEMTRLGNFIDTNKHVRQKQIELDNVMSHAVEDLDRLRQVPRDLQNVLLRLDVLEAGRTEDVRRIRSLEKELTHLKAIQQDHTTKTAGSQTVFRIQQAIMRTMTPPPLLNDGHSDATTEAEDEELAPMQKPTHEGNQVRQYPEMRERNPSTTFAPSVTSDSPTKSARQRLMQRPSIHDSMLLRNSEEQEQLRTPYALPDKPGYDILPSTQLLPHIQQARSPAPIPTREAPSHARVSPPPTQLLRNNRTSPVLASVPASTCKARPRARVAPPSTQLVSKAGSRKRKLPEREPQNQRVTRAQAKKIQAQEADEQKPLGAASSIPFPSVQPAEPALSSRKKRKTAHAQEPDQIKAEPSTTTWAAHRTPAISKRSAAADRGKNTATEPTQRVTRSPAKSNVPKVITSPVKKKDPFPVRSNAANPQKQRSLIVVLRSPQKAARTRRSESDDTESTPADRVKMSPRKAAIMPLSRSKARKRSNGTRAKPEISGIGAF